MPEDQEKEPTEEIEPVTEEVPEFEDRIDAYGIAQFAALGFTGRLPDPYVEAYRRFKLIKDKIHPGNLSAEAIVTIIMVADLFD